MVTALPGVMFTFALLMGGFAALPLSVPPLPPDPVIQRVAPDECLVYFSGSGLAMPDAASPNPTEQLLANEEVRQFVNQLGTEIVKFARQKATGDPQGELFAAELPGVLHALTTRPLAIYLAKVEIAPAGPDVRGGLVLNAGQGAAALEASLNKIQSALLASAPSEFKVKSVDVAGIKLSQLPTPPDAPQIVWGFKKQYLLIAFGEDSAKDLIARLSDSSRKAPGWLAQLQKRLPVERTSTVSYLNVAGILKAAEPALTDPQAKAVLAALGVDKLRSVGSVAGMSKTGLVNRTWLALDGEPTGIFALASAQGISPTDLSIIPADVTIAQVVKLDLAEVYRRVLEGVGAIEPQAFAQAKAGIQQVEGQIGINFDKDLFLPLGDVWSLFNLPNSGGPVGIAVSASLRDRDKFAATHDKLLALAKQAVAQREEIKVVVKESDYKGNRIYTLQGVGNAALPLSPTWCITKDRLLVTLYPQLMKSLLNRTSKDKSLADVPEVKSLLAGDAPIMIGFQETSSMVAGWYTTFQTFVPVIQGQLAGRGVEFEIPDLPTQEVFAPFLKPTVSVVRRTKDGLLSEGSRTLPISVGMDAATTGVAVGLLLPAIQAAREAARRTSAINNVKQIVLAMHNHHDAYKGFPAPAITDKEGKPLLSWRVKILPFIEENDLYKEFHLDEPWDSEHNKKLIPRLPVVYQNPSRENNDGTTTFLLPTGPAGLFKDEAKKVGMSTIKDGTSNTIMVIEVSEDRAVPWTKPDDYKVDPKQPLAGLESSRPGGVFIAGFADGHVSVIAPSIDPEVLRALFTPDGGEVVKLP